MNQFRRCSRPGCGQPAVATLTYAYSHSTAFIGPLMANDDPHSWDLCERHAAKITPPLGWELVRVPLIDDDDELTALAEAVREAGTTTSGLLDATEEFVPNHPVRRPAHKATRRAHLTVVPDVDDTDDEPSS